MSRQTLVQAQRGTFPRKGLLCFSLPHGIGNKCVQRQSLRRCGKAGLLVDTMPPGSLFPLGRPLAAGIILAELQSMEKAFWRRAWAAVAWTLKSCLVGRPCPAGRVCKAGMNCPANKACVARVLRLEKQSAQRGEEERP